MKSEPLTSYSVEVIECEGGQGSEREKNKFRFLD